MNVSANIRSLGKKGSAVTLVGLMFLLLVAKDSAILQNKYLFRVSAALIGLAWLVQKQNLYISGKAFVSILFPLVCVASSVWVEQELFEYVLYQGVYTLLIAIVLSVYFSTYRNPSSVVSERLFKNLAQILTFVMICSLVVYFVLGEKSFEVGYFGERRFRGVFGEPATLAIYSGFLVLIAWFQESRILKYAAVFLGVACLTLTMSRTPWVALILVALTGFYYKVFSEKGLVTKAIALLAAALFFSSVGMSYKYFFTGESAKELVRTESLESMSGRTELWAASFNAFSKSPIVGYGYTIGGRAVVGDDAVVSTHFANLSSDGKTPLHNGYIQVMLDSGILGIFAFGLVLVPCLFRILFQFERFPMIVPLSALYMFSVNITESVSGGVATGKSFLFYCLMYMVFFSNVKNGTSARTAR